MATTEPNAASKSPRAAAMVKRAPPPTFLPETEEDAVALAVRDILQAANTLCTAADMAEEGTIVEHYINTAIRLRDLATCLSPDKPEWPANVIQFIPRSRG